MKGLGY